MNTFNRTYSTPEKSAFSQDRVYGLIGRREPQPARPTPTPQNGTVVTGQFVMGSYTAVQPQPEQDGASSSQACSSPNTARPECGGPSEPDGVYNGDSCHQHDHCQLSREAQAYRTQSRMVKELMEMFASAVTGMTGGNQGGSMLQQLMAAMMSSPNSGNGSYPAPYGDIGAPRGDIGGPCAYPAHRSDIGGPTGGPCAGQSWRGVGGPPRAETSSCPSVPGFGSAGKSFWGSMG